MDKNKLIGFTLLALVVFGFSYYESHNRAQQMEELRIQDSINQINAAKEIELAQKKQMEEAVEKADTLNPLH